jgi:hypothetical protein
MGEIVCLPDRIARPLRRAEINQPGASAQILMFTGIRYERMGDPQVRPDPKKPRGRRRA